mmetsp:Transcript_27237/g.73377  ORF Transcript_27237/g.73377 Transcript_27237/m.73377 type:complete len:222 (-) Transcript_27237:42-707(-)
MACRDWHAMGGAHADALCARAHPHGCDRPRRWHQVSQRPQPVPHRQRGPPGRAPTGPGARRPATPHHGSRARAGRVSGQSPEPQEARACFHRWAADGRPRGAPGRVHAPAPQPQRAGDLCPVHQGETCGRRICAVRCRLTHDGHLRRLPFRGCRSSGSRPASHARGVCSAHCARPHLSRQVLQLIILDNATYRCESHSANRYRERVVELNSHESRCQLSVR